MATDVYFLKIDGIDGDSTDAQHGGEIDVESWSWGESHPNLAASGGGGGVGKAVSQDFNFVALSGRQSPKLMLACASGQRIKFGVLACRKDGEVPLEFLKIRIDDVLISSYQVGATKVGGDPTPRDQFSLNFAKIEMTGTSNVDGSSDNIVPVAFDFRLNR